MEDFELLNKNSLINVETDKEVTLSEAADKMCIRNQIPFHLQLLSLYINDEDYEGVPEDPEERSKVRITTVYNEIECLINYLKTFTKTIDFNLLNQFKIHDLLFSVLSSEPTPMLYNIILKVFVLYYLPNDEGRKILLQTPFVDFLISEMDSPPIPFNIPLIFYAIYLLLPFSPQVKAKFISVGAQTYVSTLMKLAESSLTPPSGPQEDEEAAPSLGEAFSEPTFTENELEITYFQSAQLMDDIMRSFKQEEFDIAQIFPFVKELFETKITSVMIKLFHGLKTALLRYRSLFQKMNEFGFDFEVLAILNSKTEVDEDLFLEAFLYLCAICYNCPFACDQYISLDLFNKMVQFFSPMSKVLEISLFNLDVLIQQTPNVTKFFVQSSLFDRVAELFQHKHFPISLQSLMILINIMRITEDEEIMNIVLGTGVIDAFEIMLDVDYIQPQMEFLGCLQHLIEFSQKHNRKDILDLIIERDWISTILDEYAECEYEDVSCLATELNDRFAELSK